MEGGKEGALAYKDIGYGWLATSTNSTSHFGGLPRAWSPPLHDFWWRTGLPSTAAPGVKA